MPYIYQSVSERSARPKRCRSSGPITRALMSRMRKSIPGAVFDRATASEQSGRSSAAPQISAYDVIARLLTNPANYLNTSAEPRRCDITKSVRSSYFPAQK
jgi:hypothetical protein